LNFKVFLQSHAQGHNYKLKIDQIRFISELCRNGFVKSTQVVALGTILRRRPVGQDDEDDAQGSAGESEVPAAAAGYTPF
jgi:hypothetical protein